MKHEDGYILASAIGVILAISIVAAALVGVSGDAAFGVKRAERDAIRDATLNSAINVLATQLLEDPRRRSIDVESSDTLQILGQAVRFRIRWESAKLDVNTAEIFEVEQALRGTRMETAQQRAAISEIRAFRLSGTPIRLMSDVAPAKSEEDCLSEILTVFGGMPQYDSQTKRDLPPIGRPAAGSKLALDVAVTGQEADGLSVVLMITGGANTPWRVMDWRESSVLKGENCRAA